jgi:prepilin-type N-terminal cleavage/methylation domain-containing protein
MRNVMLRTPHSALRTLRSRGFTLLELLVVVTIMIFITLIVVLNYFGGTRSAGYAAANRNVFDALMLARQRACMDGSRTFLCLLDSTNYVIVRSVSTISAIVPGDSVGELHDYYADLAAYQSANYTSNTFVLVNMDRPNLFANLAKVTCGSWQVTNHWGQHNIEMNKLAVSNTVVANWQPGDRYGIELHTRQALPPGFYFCQAPNGNVSSTPIVSDVVKFNPDGTLDNGHQDQWVGIAEEVSVRSGHFSATNSILFRIGANGHIKALKGSGG